MNILAELLNGPFGATLERDILPAWLPRRRWFRSKSRRITPGGVTLEARVPLGEWPHAPVLTVVRVAYEITNGGGENPVERYALPLVLVSREEAVAFPEGAILGPAPDPDGKAGQGGVLCDACWHDGFREAWMEILAGKHVVELPEGTLRGHPLSSVLSTLSSAWAEGPSRVLGGEQSNTSFVSGAAFVKLYRRLEEGVHPEPEMLRFLREHTDYRGVPGFISSAEWKTGRHPGHGVFTAALAQELVAGEDAWTFMLARLGAGTPDADARASADPHASRLAALLGNRVGALHAALGSRPDFPPFAREPLTDADLETVRAATRTLLAEGLRSLEEAVSRGALPPVAVQLARTVLDARNMLGDLITRAGASSAPGGAGSKIRTHGDLHLGQILVNGDDARILDFEGEPGRPLAAARVKQSPLRDAAGMLRSFHYAAHVAAREGGSLKRADALADRLRAAFLRDYFAAIEPAGLLPGDERARHALLNLFVLEKAVYELHYELNNRPDWGEIPLRGLVGLLTPPDKAG